MRHGLQSLFETENDIEIVAEAKDGEEAVSIAKKMKPDIVIMDLVMPRKDGVEATAEILAACSETKIIILTSFSTSDKIARAIENGASGALLKTAEDKELVSAVRKTAAGEKVISPSVKKLLASDPPVPKLTPRQTQILQAMTRGLTNKEIAALFGIRTDGVNEHVLAILAKLGASNRTEAVATALRKRLVNV